MTTSPFHELELAVIEAGEMIVAGAGQAVPLPDSADPLNPTTSLDRRVDAFLHERLLAALDRSVAYLTEERSDDPARLGAREVLIVDPIDGTRSLLLGRQEVAVSVALWREGEVVWGCIYNPFTRDLFVAEAGKGTWHQGKRVRVSEGHDPAKARVLLSLHEHDRGLLKALDGRLAYQAVGSIAWKMALVAAGKAEATFTAFVRHEWDVAAGYLLVREAGGRVTDVAGLDLRFNQADLTVHGLVASNGRLHEAMMGYVRLL